MGDFRLDSLHQGVAQGQRCDRDLLQTLGGRISGHVIEHSRGVPTQHLILGEIAEIGVTAGGDWVVIAGAEMHIAAQIRALPAMHQADFGVGFQIDKSVDDLHAGALKLTGPADIGLFVEPGLQLNQGGDVLARLGRLDQGVHDRGIFRGAIKRLLDRDHLWVARRLAQKLDHHIEGFERVMDDDVLGPNGGKTIPGEIPDALGETDVERLEQQIRTLIDDQFQSSVQPRQAFENKHVARVDIALIGDKTA